MTGALKRTVVCLGCACLARGDFFVGSRIWSGRVDQLRESCEVLDVKLALTNSRERIRDKLLGVIGVSNIFIADFCCDPGVELPTRLAPRSVTRIALDGISVFVMKTHCLKRFHFFKFSPKVWARRSRSSRRAS